jgi:hypothetical protein
MEGFVKDATNTKPISGAKVHITMSSNLGIDVLTDENGKYVVRNIRSGQTTFSIEADGYVKGIENLVITGNMIGSRASDFFLSPRALSGDWRTVLTWGQYPTDLDVYLYSSAASCRVYYGAKKQTCLGATVTLDTDDRNGFGPETVTIKNAGDFSSTFLFYVHLYEDTHSPKTPLQESRAKVEIYRGNHRLQTMEINTNGYIDELAKKWLVARLDPRTGKASECRNALCT